MRSIVAIRGEGMQHHSIHRIPNGSMLNGHPRFMKTLTRPLGEDTGNFKRES